MSSGLCPSQQGGAAAHAAAGALPSCRILLGAISGGLLLIWLNIPLYMDGMKNIGK